ncbi:MAG: hypothetical protein M1464_00755 [Candidatus Thermoplasmatota archaeon]|jgi:hypothetical protein|nr:hypothetical protein [Candidatus Thermoplasmatota archaeon]
MNSSIKYVLVAAVAVMVIVPGVYVIMQLQSADSRSSNPMNFLPSNVTAVAMISHNGTAYYPFAVNGSAGMVLQASLTTITSGKSSLKLNISSTVLTEPSTYKGFSVFEISRLNLLSLFSNGVNSSMMQYMGAFLNYTNLSGITNISLYAANPSSSVTVVGELGAVYAALDTYSGRTSLNPALLSTPDRVNMSLYIPLHSRNISYISSNLSSSNLTINVALTSSKLAEQAYLAYLTLSPAQFQMRIVSSSTILITVSNSTFLDMVSVNNLFKLINLSGFSL